MKAIDYIKSTDGNANIQSLKERLFHAAPDFVHSIESDASELAALRAENAKLREALRELLDAYNTCQCGCDPDDKWHEARRALESSNE